MMHDLSCRICANERPGCSYVLSGAGLGGLCAASLRTDYDCLLRGSVLRQRYLFSLRRPLHPADALVWVTLESDMDLRGTLSDMLWLFSRNMPQTREIPETGSDKGWLCWIRRPDLTARCRVFQGWVRDADFAERQVYGTDQAA